MKWPAYFLLIILVVACDPYGFGFKLNPATILGDAFEAIQTESKASFLRVSGKEAFCIYGNDEGMAYLKRHATINESDIKLNLKLLKETYFDIPEYVGYWSYFNQRYMMDVIDRKSEDVLIQVVVDCHYGMDGQKNANHRRLKREKYRRKECKLTKILPKSFEALKLPTKCNVLKVDL